MTRDRYHFRPAVDDPLEMRLAPSVAAAQVAALNHPVKVTTPRGIGAKVDQVFAGFSADYFKNRETYLAGLTAPAAAAAFQAYTTQRISVLSQGLATIFLHVTGSTSRPSHKPPQIQTFLQNRITNAANPAGLAYALNNQALPPTNVTPATLPLYTQTATQAIQAAHDASLNAIRFLTSGAFSTQQGNGGH